MYELATECKQLQSHLHVSTAYTNSDKLGYIREEVYPMSEDPQALIEKIAAMPESRAIAETEKLIGSFPNTYTFTKSMAERVLLKL